jgi:hypothetical protein
MATSQPRGDTAVIDVPMCDRLLTADHTVEQLHKRRPMLADSPLKFVTRPVG